MNRQQRRAAGVSGNRDPARMMRQSDIDRIRQQAELDASAEAVAMLLSLVIKVMHEKYGWGFKRLGDLSEAIVDEWNTVDRISALNGGRAERRNRWKRSLLIWMNRWQRNIKIA